MLHPVSNEYLKLYTLKDIYALEEVSNLYSDYGRIYENLNKLGFELAYIDDSQKMYFIETAKKKARESVIVSNASKKSSYSADASNFGRDYGLKSR